MVRFTIEALSLRLRTYISYKFKVREEVGKVEEYCNSQGER